MADSARSVVAPALASIHRHRTLRASRQRDTRHIHLTLADQKNERAVGSTWCRAVRPSSLNRSGLTPLLSSSLTEKRGRQSSHYDPISAAKEKKKVIPKYSAGPRRREAPYHTHSCFLYPHSTRRPVHSHLIKLPTVLESCKV